MIQVFVASTHPAGKTALCSAIGRKLIEKGLATGCFKPVTVSESGSPDAGDCIALAESLELAAPKPEQLCALHVAKAQLAASLEKAEFDAAVKESCNAAASGRQAMVIEGLSGAGTDDTATKANARLAELLDARAIVVTTFSTAADAPKLAAAAKAFGPRFLGAAVIGVPRAKLEKTTADLKAAWEAAGVRVLGVLPEDRTLLGVTVAELAKLIDARVASGKTLSGVAENVLLGALSPDSGIDYFSRKDNKAVILRGDRPDMALAALQTSTACVVLTGGGEPEAIVTLTAEKRRVPVLVTKTDTAATLAAVEKALSQARFRGPRKYDRMDELMAKHFDFASLFKELGV